MGSLVESFMESECIISEAFQGWLDVYQDGMVLKSEERWRNYGLVSSMVIPCLKYIATLPLTSNYPAAMTGRS